MGSYEVELSTGQLAFVVANSPSHAVEVAFAENKLYLAVSEQATAWVTSVYSSLVIGFQVGRKW